MLILGDKFKDYALKFIFNDEEFGQNYRMEPNLTVVTERMLERKKVKELISFLACFNGYGSKNFDLIIIGSTWKPHQFKKTPVLNWASDIMQTSSHGLNRS